MDYACSTLACEEDDTPQEIGKDFDINGEGLVDVVGVVFGVAAEEIWSLKQEIRLTAPPIVGQQRLVISFSPTINFHD